MQKFFILNTFIRLNTYYQLIGTTFIDYLEINSKSLVERIFYYMNVKTDSHEKINSTSTGWSN